MSGLIGLLQAIPQIVSLISRLVDWFNQESTKRWLAELDEATGKLEKSKTTEERTNAARDLVRLIRAL